MRSNWKGISWTREPLPVSRPITRTRTVNTARPHRHRPSKKALASRITFRDSGFGVTCWEDPVLVLAQLADVLKGKDGMDAHQVSGEKLEYRPEVKTEV